MEHRESSKRKWGPFARASATIDRIVREEIDWPRQIVAGATQLLKENSHGPEEPRRRQEDAGSRETSGGGAQVGGGPEEDPRAREEARPGEVRPVQAPLLGQVSQPHGVSGDLDPSTLTATGLDDNEVPPAPSDDELPPTPQGEGTSAEAANGTHESNRTDGEPDKKVWPFNKQELVADKVLRELLDLLNHITDQVAACDAVEAAQRIRHMKKVLHVHVQQEDQ